MSILRQVYNQVRLGLNIRMRRHILKLTQAQLAEKAGCAMSTVSALERGKRDISVELLFALSRALDCPVRELLLNVE